MDAEQRVPACVRPTRRSGWRLATGRLELRKHTARRAPSRRPSAGTAGSDRSSAARGHRRMRERRPRGGGQGKVRRGGQGKVRNERGRVRRQAKEGQGADGSPAAGRSHSRSDRSCSRRRNVRRRACGAVAVAVAAGAEPSPPRLQLWSRGEGVKGRPRHQAARPRVHGPPRAGWEALGWLPGLRLPPGWPPRDAKRSPAMRGRGEGIARDVDTLPPSRCNQLPHAAVKLISPTISDDHDGSIT